ncbi:hypothetical protein L1987_65917 [Smallanthus sonchifolius]|uniref:Uncharacterized protein n=1 Tax=Smallanthus sonchifolius TaxID=185202 RepID=A0ACB9BVV8_9ASTR|nr:hypothetical protein L1987_65917 [Smallanthus sonchifolius]
MKDHPGFTTFSSLGFTMLPQIGRYIDLDLNVTFFSVASTSVLPPPNPFLKFLSENSKFCSQTHRTVSTANFINPYSTNSFLGDVCTGGKGSVRRKKKAVHKTTTIDDKRLQSTLKRIRSLNPKVQASIGANTWVVSGSPQIKISLTGWILS